MLNYWRYENISVPLMALLTVNELFKNASYMINKPSFLFGNNAVLNGGNPLELLLNSGSCGILLNVKI